MLCKGGSALAGVVRVGGKVAWLKPRQETTNVVWDRKMNGYQSQIRVQAPRKYIRARQFNGNGIGNWLASYELAI
jgi:hypothetical protein